MANVNYVREDVREAMKRWNVLKDCLIGEDAIKSKGQFYLPKPNQADESKENEIRYRQYLKRAVYENFVGRTHTALIGEVFAKDPNILLPPEFDIVKVDADGDGNSIEQVSKKALGFALAYARGGLFVDYPTVEGIVTKAQQDAGLVRPTITLYDPFQIINWRHKTVGAKNLLSLVVLDEFYISEDDGFEIKTSRRWRVLKLDENNEYEMQLWEVEKGASVQTRVFRPLDASGARFKEIPFTFFGAMNNDSNIDLSPLYDLATINIAHYRNSADNEENIFITGQPTYWVAGVDQEWNKEVFKGKLLVGSRAVIPLPPGGSAGILQQDANTSAREGMKDKQEIMVNLGAKLVEQKTVVRTATEATQQLASENSVLSACAKNVSEAFRRSIDWCCNFLGLPTFDETDEMEFDLNTDYSFSKMTSEERKQLLAEWQAGGITTEEYRFNIRKANVGYLDDEVYKAQIDSETDSTDVLGKEVERLRLEAEKASLADPSTAKTNPSDEE